MSNLLKEIDLIERITIFETGSSCVEFNRCMCLDELEYTRREMANADKLHESGKKLIYYPKQKSFKTIHLAGSKGKGSTAMFLSSALN